MTQFDLAAALASIRTTGIAALPPLEEINALRTHLESGVVYFDAHMPETARKRGDLPVPFSSDRAMASECVCAPMDLVIKAPGLFERGLGLRRLAQDLLRADQPLAYSMNAFWTRPGPAGTRPDIQEFHRDYDDPKGFVAVFVYLTDVLTDEDGPHELKGPDGIARKVFGPAGTMFAAQTSHEHRGLKPTRGTGRGIAWLRWGVSDPPPSYQWDGNRPVDPGVLGDRYPADPILRNAIRLLVA